MEASVQIAELRTARVLLRQWRAADRGPFAAMNADPQVMEHFPATLSQAESDAMADRVEAAIAENGWGLWAAERLDSGEFIGFVGLNLVKFDARFLPAVEVGWRLAHAHWGHGLAPEAAAAALEYGFGELGLAEIVSFTSVVNLRSQRVMQKLGMHRDPADDFDHLGVPASSPLSRHVLYRLSASDWLGEGAKPTI